MRAAIYARVSTEEQALNYSIENQLERMRSYCQEQGHQVVEEYVDPGYSGTTLERPELQRLMIDAREGLFDLIVVYKLDRLFRSNRHMYNTLAEWAELQIGFVSVTEAFDSNTAMGKAYLGMASTFAEWERNTFVERSRDGMERAVRKGHYTGGIVAYGYKVEPGSKVVSIDEEEAKVVRDIFTWLVDERLSIYAIAKRLNALGVPTKYTREGRGVRGLRTAGAWSPSRVSNLVRNPAYKGMWVYGKRSAMPHRRETPGIMPMIVNGDLWANAQAALQNNNAWAKRNGRREYLLRGLIKCSLCGHSYTGFYSHTTGKAELRYYRCNWNGTRGHFVGGRCGSPSIRADVIEDRVWSDICQFIQSPEAVLQALEANHRKLEVDFDGELAKIERRMKELVEAERRLLRLYADPSAGFSRDALDAEMENIRTSRDLLQRNKRELEEAKENQDLHKLKLENADRLLRRLQESIVDVTPALKRAIVETLVQGITVEPGEDGSPLVRIRYVFHGDGRVQLRHAGMCVQLLQTTRAIAIYQMYPLRE